MSDIIDLTADRAFTEGEIPPPLRYVFQDATGTPVELEAAAGAFIYARWGESPVERTVLVDADSAAGAVTYSWTVDDMATPGDYSGRFWLGDGINRLASPLIIWTVDPASAVADV